MIFSLLRQNVFYELFFLPTEVVQDWHLTFNKKKVFFNTACCYGFFVAQKMLRRRPVVFFRFYFNNITQSKKEFCRVFIELKVGALVAEYFEEKQI